jgi:putative transposase
MTCSVPELSPDLPTMDNTIGVDMGLKAFLVADDGEEVAIPQHYRKAEKRLERLQRSLSRKKKGSNRRKKAVNTSCQTASQSGKSAKRLSLQNG